MGAGRCFGELACWLGRTHHISPYFGLICVSLQVLQELVGWLWLLEQHLGPGLCTQNSPCHPPSVGARAAAVLLPVVIRAQQLDLPLIGTRIPGGGLKGANSRVLHCTLMPNDNEPGHGPGKK